MAANKTASKSSAPACPPGATRMLVRCGKPTKPPYTGEKDPGRCSRTKAFCVPPTPDWTCWQHGKDYTTVKNPRHFKNCAEAVQYFEDQQAQKKYEATTNPFLRHADATPTITRDGKDYVATTQLRWRVDASQTVITLPDISWDNMSPADLAAVANLNAALRAHGEGHLNIANRYVSELQADTVSATAATEAQARAALKTAIAAREQAVVAELRTRNNGYDTVTNHGSTQSRLGGKDTTLDCPPSQ